MTKTILIYMNENEHKKLEDFKIENRLTWKQMLQKVLPLEEKEGV